MLVKLNTNSQLLRIDTVLYPPFELREIVCESGTNNGSPGALKTSPAFITLFVKAGTVLTRNALKEPDGITAAPNQLSVERLKG